MPRSMDIRRPQRANIDLKPGRPEGSAQNSIRVNYRKSAQPKALPDYFREGGPIHKSFSNSPRKKKSSWATIFIILLLLLVGAAIAGFFIFGNTGLGGKSLKLSLELPEKAVAGEDFTLSLTYRNLDKVSLTNSEIVIEYPENFYFTEATLAPINPENNVWRPEPIGPGEEKKIEIKGYLIGEIGEQKEFKVIFHYQPENFNSTFQEDISQTTTISNSAVVVVLESLAEIDDGAVTQLKIRVKNNSSTDLNNLALSFDLGEALEGR